MEEWLINYGYWGLFLGAFLAATIIPLSSEIFLTAVLETGGDPFVAVTLATAGNWLGGMTSFGLGWLGKWEWIEKWLKVSREKLERQKARITRYGSLLAFFTWLPGIGDLMAVGLGFYRISPAKTALFMLTGKCARFAVWAVLYFWIRPMIGG